MIQSIVIAIEPLMYYSSRSHYRRKGGPSPTFLPLEKLVVRTINVLLMRPCLFNHLRARGIHVSASHYDGHDDTFHHNISTLKLAYHISAQVYFWVLNKDEEFKKAFELGATGVMTDYPTRLKLFLKNSATE